MVEQITNRAHGGRLINRIAGKNEREILLRKANELPKIELSRREVCDLELIANGAYSPLEGFIGRSDFINILENKRLTNGLAWTIPVTLAVTRKDSKRLSDQAALTFNNNIVAIIEISEIFEHDREDEALKIYKTTDRTHPGVQYTLQRGNSFVAGKITLLNKPIHNEFLEHTFEPEQIRAIVSEKGWRTIVAFQTRNPIHRAHEYLLKTALESHDGLLIHPLVGETKSDDIPAEIRLSAYKALVEGYFPSERVLLSALPASMRYAGPREAIHHAIIRQNYGATHFIVGRDHAGVGNFYGPYDAQKIFHEFSKTELQISPLFFENAFYCKRCENIATEKTCPHSSLHRLNLSGTQARNILAERGKLPREFTRPEIAEILANAYQAKGGLEEALRRVGI